MVEEGTILGIASFRPPQDGPAGTVKLFQFHVDPDHWRRGIGTALHAACVARWRADGRHCAVLDVHVGQSAAPGPSTPATAGSRTRRTRPRRATTTSSCASSVPPGE